MYTCVHVVLVLYRIQNVHAGNCFEQSIFAWRAQMHCDAVFLGMNEGLLAECPVLDPSGLYEAG